MQTKTSRTGETRLAGFTLLEMLVVLTILGLAVLLAMPTLERSLPGLELRTEARDVASILREARARAIGRNEVLTMVVDRQARIVRADGKQVAQLNPRIAIFTSMEALSSSGTADEEIRFFPDGTSTGADVTLALGGRQKHVLVDWLTGAVSITE